MHPFKQQIGGSAIHRSRRATATSHTCACDTGGSVAFGDPRARKKTRCAGVLAGHMPQQHHVHQTAGTGTGDAYMTTSCCLELTTLLATYIPNRYLGVCMS
jgi:hypothetical protein